ncbi:hypothetical protein BAUCODRAFT_161655 [Baudoinia panamericana UAMH 10762]|uniref:Uncharacterized protein n=1 Tax=Baudoinia panamericana (strain UAMH 10762) TaxID=717646 RepID=M2MTW9_BAUPA|nr:uncharacterized protein BAUCODRAFT_161655 [Baudoinia panamericana UAMH 10762]EMD00372.1 hypothetical protein BAUCODRAFT_161655 [Baudoinia panamericana UAMH 10762]
MDTLQDTEISARALLISPQPMWPAQFLQTSYMVDIALHVMLDGLTFHVASANTSRLVTSSAVIAGSAAALSIRKQVPTASTYLPQLSEQLMLFEFEPCEQNGALSRLGLARCWRCDGIVQIEVPDTYRYISPESAGSREAEKHGKDRRHGKQGVQGSTGATLSMTSPVQKWSSVMTRMNSC